MIPKSNKIKLILLLASAMLLNSCSSYLKEKAIAYKHRNDFRVNTKWKKGDFSANKSTVTVESQQANEMLLSCDASTTTPTESFKEQSFESKYFTGDKKIESTEKPTLREKAKIARAVAKIYKEIPSEKKKEIKALAKTNGSDKSQIITLLLAGIFILTGIAGIHRFYLGGSTNIIIGIVQLLTFGCCGVWWLIDVIRILTGDLVPPSGSYNPKL